MSYTIRFPHLGITIPHLLRYISIGSFEIACYGVVLAFAMITGILLAMKVADVTGQKGDDYFDLGIIAVIVSVLCARIYYVAFSWDYYQKHLLEIFNLRQGGLAIYGGVIGGVITVFLFCKKRKIKYYQALDTAVIGLVWGQMAGRWGNFFNREAFGGYTDGLLAMQLPEDAVRASEITQQMRDHMQIVDGVSYIQVHPTFLYESLWNLGVLFVLLFVTFKIKERYNGMVFLLYLLLYGLGRMWIEGLRTDQLLIPGTVIPVSQVLSFAIVVFAGVLLLRNALKKKGTKEHGSKGTVEKRD